MTILRGIVEAASYVGVFACGAMSLDHPYIGAGAASISVAVGVTAFLWR
jgi:hypothetical protein